MLLKYIKYLHVGYIVDEDEFLISFDYMMQQMPNKDRRQINLDIVDNFNGDTYRTLGIKFKTKSNAQNCLEWLESEIIMEKLIG